MKRPAAEQVRFWNVDLASTATKATTIADCLRDTVDGMHRTIDAMNWSGEARNTVDGRCTREVTEMRVIAAAYEDLAAALNDGHARMGQLVSQLRTDYTSLTGAGYKIESDWTVSAEGEDGARKQEATNQTIRLQRLADELGWADADCAAGVKSSVDAINELTPENAGVNPRQAREDVDAFRNGTATLEQVERLTWATTLTDQQKADLAAGRQVNLPQERLDYLNSVMRDLDGLPVGEISKIGAGLPNGEDKVVAAGLADALQLTSNPQVTGNGLTAAQGGKAGVDFGGLGALPSSVRTALTDPPKNSSVKRTNVETVAEILSKGSPQVAQGSDADRALLNQATDITKQIDAEANPLASKLFSQVSSDHIAVNDFFTGQGMDAVMAPGEKFDNQAAIGTLLDHNWHGEDAGVSALLKTVDTDASSPDQHINTEAGQSARQIADYVATHRDTLLHITSESGHWNPSNTPTSIGALNPNLTAQLGDTLANYIPAMAGVDDSDLNSHGFVDSNSRSFSAESMRNVFAVIDSDPEAAKMFNANAYQQIAGLNQIYGATGLTDTRWAEWGAHIDKAAQDGANLELKTRQDDNTTTQKNTTPLFDGLREVAAYELKKVPVAGGLLELGWKSISSEVRLETIGTIATEGTHVDLHNEGSIATQSYNILQGLASSPDHGDLRNDPNIGKYFEPATGELRSFTDIANSYDNQTTSYGYLNQDLAKYAPSVHDYRTTWGNSRSTNEPK
ncbi:TPR repeat region-containing protein [Nocardia salmonicida]|uniref:TPR repeat region-containing protein n=1 Tax=Nocardia salmonicida TaxID=53431 RepID=UPI0007A54A71|nr:hypothetical protein [Nocardia salmonicida]